MKGKMWSSCRWLGVDHVYLTENSYPIQEQLTEQLQDFIDEGFLTLESDGKKANQINIYKRCMEKYRQNHNWMAFIDIDEFIAIRQYAFSSHQHTCASARVTQLLL